MSVGLDPMAVYTACTAVAGSLVYVGYRRIVLPRLGVRKAKHVFFFSSSKGLLLILGLIKMLVLLNFEPKDPVRESKRLVLFGV